MITSYISAVASAPFMSLTLTGFIAAAVIGLLLVNAEYPFEFN